MNNRCTMKGFTVVILAVCALGASARMVTLETEAAFHTDKWCADHHLGEGPATCIQHDGCCYDGRIGICHSCDAHSDEWCNTYGGSEVKTCVGYAGCTFDYEQNDGAGACVSNSDPDAINDEVTCEEAMTAALEGEVESEYVPQCTEDGLWEEEQYDESTDSRWCVDSNGHEVPDTRMKDEAFQSRMVNCNKERKKSEGMQCPNAVTLSVGNGEVMINDHEDVGNCDITCNTDQDCRGQQWCCYNGCGYSCQVPIHPKADCEHLALDASLSASDLENNEHGTQVTLSCAPGYSGSEEVEIECKHGDWSEYEIRCMKDCEPYRVPAPGRMRDYEIKGNGRSHGDKRKVLCVKGYGAVAGSPDAMRFYREIVECVNGAWDEQTLVCSSCFDADSTGPHAWWNGKADGAERGDSYDCKYFESRPLKCAEFPEARENCRVSCRTCEEALLKYKVKAISDSKADVKHPEKWLQKKLKVSVGYQYPVTEQRRVKVARRQKKAGVQ